MNNADNIISENEKLEKELLEQIHKRNAMANDTEKRKDIIMSILVLVVTAIIGVCILVNFLNKANNEKLRNFATEEMSDKYENVYADVISIVPQYSIESQNDSKSGVPYGLPQVDSVICICETVEGKTIWASFSDTNYPKAYESEGYGLFSATRIFPEFDPQIYSSTTPLRLQGRVKLSGKQSKELESEIGDVFILVVSYTTQEQ